MAIPVTHFTVMLRRIVVKNFCDSGVRNSIGAMHLSHALMKSNDAK